MNDQQILQILKIDLHLSASAYDPLLLQYIAQARSAIATEGIRLRPMDEEDSMLIEAYAAYLYRQRESAAMQMPKALRWQLNNKLISQKMKGECDGRCDRAGGSALYPECDRGANPAGITQPDICHDPCNIQSGME